MVDFNLYLITDRKQIRNGDLPAAVEQALMGGVKAIQLREKDLGSRDLYALALELRSLTKQYDARLLINDRIDIALAVDADGVHLPENGLPADLARKLLPPTKLIAVSCHDLTGALAAQESSADFITFGPVFPTPSKAMYGNPVGLEKLTQAVETVSMPVFALGGINADNIRQVLATRAAGIAMISAILGAENTLESSKEIIGCMKKSSDEL